jgi:phosphoglycolate phosphatase-like HAD superfamily hydrolase
VQPSYERIVTPQGPAFASASSKDAIASLDSIVFDCDGVLIDTKESYDAAITFTLDSLIRRMFGVSLPWKGNTGLLVQGLRNTGMFNNDWDVVYGLALYASCSLPAKYRSRRPIGSEEGQGRLDRLSKGEVSSFFRSARLMVRRLARSLAVNDNRNAAEAVWKSLPADELDVCERARDYLGYPGNPPSSLLASLFDEVYHGGSLYRKMYGLEPRYHRGKGFIERDRLIISKSDLDSLSEGVDGRLAVATGRPKIAAEYSLGKLISYFRLGASVFIGDGDIRPTPEAASFKKPSGKSLLWAREKFGSKMLLYVGDSAEDLQMVTNARRSTDSFVFAGIYSSSYEPAEQVSYFKKEGAELILPTVRSMARVMRGVAS